ncbi:hypothetical protein [Mesorhizobium sp. WSM2561]|uniref:hypothetical protein n=1 Tax=Mesorhizobium sp. WSM2561 TaxID=1040985 RepID=UPI0012EBF8FE|nr:hypothetical protein [Mesorhizobium sp. WSM2561]
MIDVLRRRQMAILNPKQWDDRNDRYFMELYQEHRGAKSLYGLCAAMCPERTIIGVSSRGARAGHASS